MCTEVIGMTQMAHDWGVSLEGRIYVDSSAAIGVAQRKGNGKLRHVKVGLLWIQEKILAWNLGCGISAANCL